MKEIFQYAMERFGRSVTIQNGQTGHQVTAFLQAVTSMDKRFYKNVVTDGGIVSSIRYLYLGPADIAVEGCRIECGSESFVPVSAAAVSAGGEQVCMWAILRKVG